MLKMHSKADVVRAARRTARNMKGASKYYRRIGKIEEFDIGTEKERHVVTLKKPWSWTDVEVNRVMEFPTYSDYMRLIRFTFKVDEVELPAEVESPAVESHGFECKLKQLAAIRR